MFPIFLFWLLDSWVWWFCIGLLAGWSIMRDEYEVYTERSAALRVKCEQEGKPFDPIQSLKERGDFQSGIFVNGIFLGLLLCFTDRIFYLLFLV
jgi:hypothetical protein